MLFRHGWTLFKFWLVRSDFYGISAFAALVGDLFLAQRACGHTNRPGKHNTGDRFAAAESAFALTNLLHGERRSAARAICRNFRHILNHPFMPGDRLLHIPNVTALHQFLHLLLDFLLRCNAVACKPVVKICL